MIVLLAVALTLGLAAFVLHPLARGGADPLEPPDPHAAEAERRVRAAAVRLRELEADLSEGRLAEEDYRAMRPRLDAEASRGPRPSPPGGG